MSSDLVGHQLGSYKIEELIERGGMVEVYRGRHVEIDRYVTIKVIGRHLESDPLLNERFRRELRAVIELRHPNIVQVYDFGEGGGGHYVVLEFTAGSDLRTFIDEMLTGRRYVDQDDISFIVRQIASALDYAHERGVIHQDVTPANILIKPSGQALLSNFGLAMLKGRDVGDSAGSGAALGTPEYMAPEQAIADSGRISSKSDIYSLGVILFQLATGTLPFTADTPTELALKHLNEPPPVPRQLNPTLPRAVSQVILTALAKEPRDRFDTALALAEALTQAWHVDDEDEIVVLKNGALRREGDTEPLSLRRPTAPAPSAPPTQPAAPPPQAQLSTLVKRGVAKPTRGRAQGISPMVLAALAVALVVLVGVIGARVLGMDVGGILRGVLGRGAPGVAEPLVVATPTAEVEEAAAPPSPTPGLEAAGVTLTPVDTVVPEEAPIPTLEPLVGPPLVVGAQALRLEDATVMVYVPEGPFLMGTTDLSRPERERPQHEVMLSGYWIDQTEVTNAQYRLCVDAGACSPPTVARNYNDPRYRYFPVVYVTWDAANAYCEHVGRTMGLDVRLPTEAQWEKAASWDPFALAKRSYPWGEQEPAAELLRYSESYPALLEGEQVGSYPAGASAYGVLDMAGNVMEFVYDWSSEDYYSLPEAALDPQGPAEGSGRIVRGGGWAQPGPFALTTRRTVVGTTTVGNDIGFRCATNASAVTPENNVAFTPQEALGGAQAAVALALAQAQGANQAFLNDWQAALISMDAQLQAGNSAGVLQEIDARLEALTTLVETGNIPDVTALKLHNTLNWVRSQLTVGTEPSGTPPEEG